MVYIANLRDMAWVAVTEHAQLYFDNPGLRQQFVEYIILMITNDTMTDTDASFLLWTSFTEMKIACHIFMALAEEDRARVLPHSVVRDRDAVFLVDLIHIQEIDMLDFFLEKYTNLVTLEAHPMLLDAAIRTRQPEVLNKLLESGCRPVRSNLEYAILKGEVGVLETLLSDIHPEHLMLDPELWAEGKLSLPLLLQMLLPKWGPFLRWEQLPCGKYENSLEMLYHATQVVAQKTPECVCCCGSINDGFYVDGPIWFLFALCYHQQHCPFNEEQLDGILNALVQKQDAATMSTIVNRHFRWVSTSPEDSNIPVGGDDSSTILNFAVCLRNKWLARWLVAHGANPRVSVQCKTDSAIGCLVALYVQGKITEDQFYDWNEILDTPLHLHLPDPSESNKKRKKME